MRTEDIRWRSFERSALPRALFGSPDSGFRNWRLESALETGRGVALGYPEEERDQAYSPPMVIVLEDGTAEETLSWLKTFAPETSPLSQFARVVLHSDWERFGWEGMRCMGGTIREDRWACVLLGELLAQGESDIELASLPLSWGASCFSMPVARSLVLYAEGSHSTCVERLSMLEKDQKFSRRQVSVASLNPVWMSLMHCGSEIFDFQAAAEIAIAEATRSEAGEYSRGFRPADLLQVDSGLMSDSVETRVIAYQHLTAQMRERIGSNSPSALAQAVVAAGAFLVGRGSSHAFLLSRLPRQWSQSFIWFGLLAGLTGPQSWGGEWSRAVKGIERSLKGKFDWCTSQGADLSWAEYSWLAATFSGKQTFAELPKMAQRALSVEVLPGATCQLRLVHDSGVPGREPMRGEGAEGERLERELRETLERVMYLADRARQLAAGAARWPQQSLFEHEDSQERDEGPPRSRRNRRK